MATVLDATHAMTALHATEAASVHLAAWARVDGIAPADVDRALYEERSLVKQLAMRRTVFTFPTPLRPAALGGPSARVAVKERTRIIKEVGASDLTADGELWLGRARAAVLEFLDGSEPASAQAIREAVPEVQGTIAMAPGKKWGRDIPVAPWVIWLLGLEGSIIRGPNIGHWRLSRPQWLLTEQWLGETPPALDTSDAYAELIARYLHTFGPATVDDVQWWLGSTKTQVRATLESLSAVEVGLDSANESGWLLPTDLDPVPPLEPWGALLPVLDPTTMGWKLRDFYLDPQHRPFLFDTAGNGGATAWWDGRIVGAWVQDPDGAVVLGIREDIGRDATAQLEARAAELSAWLGGDRISSPYSALQLKWAPLP
ncbi:hypothetical protein N802_06975 [Knoellia sinensis KCTC 19936]|uniref:Winged helix DNA-binding domain-containing protein n=1 Tax=Knoellia sinensis KCTC 19936 TaxID=1385520 RepID=A0A0A0J1I8_9MICO|nr:hypothetical protein N802_06975 [Knoellia sinensis KCTC 19936]